MMNSGFHLGDAKVGHLPPLDKLLPPLNFKKFIKVSVTPTTTAPETIFMRESKTQKFPRGTYPQTS